MDTLTHRVWIRIRFRVQHQEAELHDSEAENWNWVSEKTAAASATEPAEQLGGKTAARRGVVAGVKLN